MLVLSRRIGESVCIGEDIRVTLIKNRKGQAKLGIVAPRTVLVTRDNVKVSVARDHIPFEVAQEALFLLELLHNGILSLGPHNEVWDKAMVQREYVVRVTNFLLKRSMERQKAVDTLTVEGGVK